MKFLTLVFPIIFINLSCTENEYKTVEKEELIEPKLPEHCRLSISHEQLKEERGITLDFPSNCDSLRLYFPSGGTITHAGLYTDSLLTEEIASTPSFDIMQGLAEGGNNFMTLANDQIGRYFLNYGSCHWGSQMWLNIQRKDS